jgi:formylglycine-generating enzyme required for sulfatase activity
MRSTIAIAAAALGGLVAIAALPNASYGQLVGEHDAHSLRSFNGVASHIRRSFQSDAEARNVLRQILAAAGLAGIEDRIILRASAETDNAEAAIENNERYIFYNAVFMQDIAKQTKDYWSMVAVLAHELGHHIRFHTVIPGREHEFELEADYQAGFILRRLGASLEQSQAVYKTFPVEATPTHPGRAQRLQAVTIGWTDGGSTQAPSWVQPPQVAINKPPPQPAPRCDGIEITSGENERRCFKRGAGKTEWFKDCETCPEMVVVPAGRFTMGSPKNDQGREPQYKDSEDQRAVRIDKPFAVSHFAVTRGEFALFVEATGHTMEGGCYAYASGEWTSQSDRNWRLPGFDQTSRHPVVCVNWRDAKAYAAWLASTTGKSYRLLSDAEREYVARAGTTTMYWWGSAIAPTQANYRDDNSSENREKTMPVEHFKQNTWGLYNVHGNVWEWVEDCWNDSNIDNPGDGSARTTGDCRRRVARGGSWRYGPRFLRSAVRAWGYSSDHYGDLGFRIGRSL